ncbi:MAG: type I phosphomannose isomerase catalytic subunit [Planctomycetota bacterium]
MSVPSDGLLTFRPHYEERVWGGRRLEGLGRKLPPDVPIGESWELSAIPGRASVVDRGSLAGLPFDELLARAGEQILGDSHRSAAPGSFPLLLKLLDSQEPLSVQVHPDDALAVEIEGPGPGSVGKTEAWVILDAEPGAEIIHGWADGVDGEEGTRALESAQGGRLPSELEHSLFRWVPVQRGDVVYVPAGTVHALGAGVMLFEFQQSSDLTYRLYDWGRKNSEGQGRELHLEKARRVKRIPRIDCPVARVESSDLSDGQSEAATLVESNRFVTEGVRLGRKARYSSSTVRDGRSGYRIVFGWEGQLRIRTENDELDVPPYTSVLVPASAGDFTLEPVPGIGGAVGLVLRGP